MSKNNISELLDKYHDGATTLEEENHIHEFMLNHPDHMRAPWFIGVRGLRLQKSTLTLSTLNQRTTSNIVWYQNQIVRIAATVLLVCVIGLIVVLNKQEQLKTVSSKESIQQIILPDGSTVTLNKNTTLRYASAFNKARELWLDEGEAFFDVVKDHRRPFVVNTEKTVIHVTGTSFNVFTNSEQSEVAVLSGRVIFGDTDRKSQSVELTKGMMAVYNTNAGKVKRDSAFDSNRIAWKTHRLEFNDASLESVANTLEKYFQIDIQTSDSTTLACRFKGIFHEANLDEIIEVLNYSLNVTLKREGSIYKLSGNGCKP